MSAIENLTVGEIVGWVIAVSAVVGFLWKGIPLVRKTSRFIDAMTGYTDPAGTRHPGLVEQVADLIREVRGLRTAVSTAATAADLEKVRRDVDALGERVNRYHPEVGA